MIAVFIFIYNDKPIQMKSIQAQYKPAHILIFAYNRPEHLQKTLTALSNNALADQSPVIIYCDGLRHAADEKKIFEVHKIAHGARGFKDVQVITRAQNLGLANSIIDGVTQVVSTYGSAIVVEDDLLSSPMFLKYMNQGLQLYKEEEKVCSIHGYSIPIKASHPTYFLRGGDCWGWATWKRAWDHFEPNGKFLLEELKRKQLSYEFDVLGCYPYIRMLESQISGKNNSWAIRWRASTFLKGMLTLYPTESLIQNFGFDGSGTHCDDEKINMYASALALHDFTTLEPVSIEESLSALKQWGDFFLAQESIRHRIFAKTKRWLNTRTL